MKRDYQTNDKTLIAALETPLVDKIFQQHDIIMVAIGGSQLLNMDDKNSDYDLAFYVADECDFQKQFDMGHLKTNNCAIHTYINPLNTIELSRTGFATSLIKQVYLTSDHILGFNPMCTPFITKGFEFRNQLSGIGMLKYREHLKTEKPEKNAYSYLLGADIGLKTKIGKDVAQQGKNNYLNLSIEQYQQYDEIIQHINSQIDQTGENGKDLGVPIYEELKMTL